MTKRSVRSICFGTLLFVMAVLALSAASFAQIGITVRFGPPPLPVYEQPMLPGDGYIWTPGYWSFDNDYDDYYWVPGTWVQAPEPGLFWTPGYWGWGGNGYNFHDGYWGPRVGYYGGINYGYGYFGEGYQGGRWDNGRFFYNRAANNVNTTIIRNVYVTEIVNVNRENRVSYNGGEGGINARPRPEDEQAERERHIPPVAAQMQQVRAARSNPQLRASENRGKPPVAATSRPGDFNDHPVAAKEAGGAYNPPPNRGGARPNGNADNRNNDNRNNDNRNAEQPNGNADRNSGRPEPGQPAGRPDDNGNKPKPIYHPNDLPARQPSNADNEQQNKKYQQQQQKMQQKEDQERQKLQQKQDRDHQQMEQRKADDAQKQQLEQRHQQQTEKLQQREDKQEQKVQSRQPKEQPRPDQGHPDAPKPPAPNDNQPH